MRRPRPQPAQRTHIDDAPSALSQIRQRLSRHQKRSALEGSQFSTFSPAAAGATVNWLIAEFDGEVLHRLPDDRATKGDPRRYLDSDIAYASSGSNPGAQSKPSLGRSEEHTSELQSLRHLV